jgi:hypothetical protein
MANAVEFYEYCTIELRDGRVLVGDYDPATGALLLNGKAGMRMTLNVDDVLRRTPATRPAVAKVEKPTTAILTVASEIGEPVKKEITQKDIDLATRALAEMIVTAHESQMSQWPEISKPITIHENMTLKQAELTREHNRRIGKWEEARRWISAKRIELSNIDKLRDRDEDGGMKQLRFVLPHILQYDLSYTKWDPTGIIP